MTYCDCHFSIGGERLENPCCPQHGRTVEPVAEGPDRFACGDCGVVNMYRPRHPETAYDHLFEVVPDPIARLKVLEAVQIIVSHARHEEREACAAIADLEQRAFEGHLRSCKLLKKRGLQHEAGAQIARDIAHYIRQRSAKDQNST
jgi:ribosomal protein S27AE